MGVCVMVMGRSGSGKSSSLRNFEEGEVGIFNVIGKPLPFRKKLDAVEHSDYKAIKETLKRNTRKAYVIDDSTYLMAFDNFRRANDSGYQKFTDMAVSFERLLETAAKTDKDTIVYFLHHPDVVDGVAKPKTIGRMLDEKLCVEGMFPIVIEATVQDGKHVFVTENDGFNCAKAPMGMFPPTMDNDLRAVDSMIREYWDMAPIGGAADADQPS